MDILQAIKNYFYTNESLDASGTIYTDYLPGSEVNYAIHKLPMADGDTLRKFVGGDLLKQFAFAFDVIATYSTANNATNNNNVKFLVELQKWIEENKNLPEVTNAQGIEVLQSGFLFDVSPDSKTAVYRMTARLVYYQERNILNVY